jgi:hypothetical protein
MLNGPEKDVAAALIELAGQPPTGHVELEECVARRKLHARDVADVPRRNDKAARVGIGPDLGDELRHLVDRRPVARRPTAPLVAVDRTQLAQRIGPFVPDRDAGFLQRAHVGLAAQEPQQFVDDRLRVDLLGRQQWKSVAQCKAHLVAEHRQGAGPGAIVLAVAVLAHVAHEIEVLAHEGGRKSIAGGVCSWRGRRFGRRRTRQSRL